jgi:hypothetical protein
MAHQRLSNTDVGLVNIGVVVNVAKGLLHISPYYTI